MGEAELKTQQKSCALLHWVFVLFVRETVVFSHRRTKPLWEHQEVVASTTVRHDDDDDDNDDDGGITTSRTLQLQQTNT